MSQRNPLPVEDIQRFLEECPGWTFQDDCLRKTFEFTSFREAISFIIRMAFEAERLDHHPELHNVYNRVDIALRTHDAGNRVTLSDVELARAIEHFSWI